MRISREDYERIVNPVLRDPELEARRLDTLHRAAELARMIGPITPERLREGIPLRTTIDKSRE